MVTIVFSIIIAWLLIVYAQYWLPVVLAIIAWGFVLLISSLIVGGLLIFLGKLW